MEENTNFALVKGFCVIRVDHIHAFALLHLFKQRVPEGEMLGEQGVVRPKAVLAVRQVAVLLQVGDKDP